MPLIIAWQPSDMARTYLVFGDIEGKLDMLHVECSRCGRRGRYNVGKLIKKIRTQRQHDEMERAAQRKTVPGGMHPKCTIGAI